MIQLTDNEFFTNLTNLALFMRLYATNTSRTAEDFVNSFATENVEYGNQKIFTFSDLPTVKDYSETSSLLSVNKQTVNQETLKITERKYIATSFSEYILTSAFTSGSGMNEFTGYLLGQMESAKTDYLYDKIISALFNKSFTGAKQNISVTYRDISNLTSAADINSTELLNNKRIAKEIQNTVENISVYNTGYNGVGYKQALSVSDMKFVFCNPYKNDSVVDLYATLLNSEYIKKSFDKPEMISIPTSKIPNGKGSVIGWLMHKYAYQWFYKFVVSGAFFDTSTLVINNFLHFWYGGGWLDNLPVAKFRAVNPPVNNE